MKAVLVDDKVEISQFARQANRERFGAGQTHARRLKELFAAVLLISTPLLILCWMSHANSSDAPAEKTSAYVAAGIVLLLSLIMGLRPRAPQTRVRP